MLYFLGVDTHVDSVDSAQDKVSDENISTVVSEQSMDSVSVPEENKSPNSLVSCKLYFQKFSLIYFFIVLNLHHGL